MEIDWSMHASTVLVLSENQRLGEVQETMTAAHASFAAVLSDDQKVLGLVSLQALSSVLSTKFGQSLFNHRPLREATFTHRIRCPDGNIENQRLSAIIPLDHVLVLRPEDNFLLAQKRFNARTEEHYSDDIIIVDAYEKYVGLMSVRKFSQIQYQVLRQQKEKIEEAHTALKKSQNQLQSEIDEAANYIHSLLPQQWTTPIQIEWRFRASTTLGGDAFNYHWLDRDHIGIYLLDVSGHGIGSALLSISVLNILRTQSLPGTDFTSPADVLSHLNKTFHMEEQDNRFFTIWYGVYKISSQQLTHSSAGHHPPVLFQTSSPNTPVELPCSGPAIGLLDNWNYEQRQDLIYPGSHLFVFSDGAFEIMLPDGTMWTHDAFLESLSNCCQSGPHALDQLMEAAKQAQCTDQLADDYSLLKIMFDSSPQGLK